MNAVTMQISKAIVQLETGSRVVFVRSSSTLLPICLHMPIRNALHFFLVGTLLACATSGPIAAQSNASFSLDVTSAATTPTQAASGYNQPPKNILDVMHAPSPPVPRVSPTQDAILLVSWQDYPSIARGSTPFLRLAGVRVEPKNHS